MKVTLAAGPMGTQVTTTSTPAANAARAKAVAMIQGQTPAPQAHASHAPQLNQNNISPEDMSAIAPPTPTHNIDTSVTSEEDTTTSAAAPAEQEETPKAPPISTQLALLSRKEKAFRQQQQKAAQDLKAQQDALAAREAALSAKEKDYQSGYIPKDLVKQQTLKVLADAGVSYEDLTQQILNQSQTNPYTESQISKLQQEIQALKAETEAVRKQSTTQQEQAVEAAVKQIRTDVARLVKTDSSFETVRATNSVNDVVDLIRKTYEEDGYIMDAADAAQEVEDYLIEEALKLTRIQKIQKRLQATGVASQTAAGASSVKTPQQPKQPQPMKTLTNATSSTRPLSARERAIAAMEGRLK